MSPTVTESIPAPQLPERNEKFDLQLMSKLETENHRMRVMLEWVRMRSQNHTHNHIISDIHHETVRFLKEHPV